MDPKWNHLRDTIERKRSCGLITCKSVDVTYSSDARSTADRIVAECGFRGLGAKWRSIERDAARTILVKLLEQDLAFGGEVMSASDAAVLADRWLEAASRSGAYLTNGNWAEPSKPVTSRASAGASWDPISESTFDAGVIAVDEHHASIFWVQDED